MSKKPLYEIPGTIAYTLNEHKDELFNISNPYKLKEKAIEIVSKATLNVPTDKDDFIKNLNKKNPNLILSILGTYMIGIKAPK